MNNTTTKTFPQVGEHLYLSQETGNCWVDMVKRPYTVISVSKTQVRIQAAKCIFPIFHYDPKTMSDYYKDMDGKRIQFYDTVAESFEEDPNGRILTLTWAPKKGRWQHADYPGDRYPEIAYFGKWAHQPYLN